MPLNRLLVAAVVQLVTCLPLGLAGPQSLPKSWGGVCTTKDCIAASHTLLQNMNLEADPCQDFYEFSCGAFEKNAVIPEDTAFNFNLVSALMDVNMNRMKRLLEADDDEDSFETDKKLRAFYKACKNETQVENLGWQPIQDLLQRLGGWPVLLADRWDESNGAWYDLVLKCAKLGLPLNLFIGIDVRTDAKDSSSRVITIMNQLDRDYTGMAWPYLVEGLDSKEVKLYYDYMVDAAVLLGAEEERARAELKDVLAFEISLARLSTPEEGIDPSKLYNPTTVGELQRKGLPGFPPSLKSFLNDMFRGAGAEDVKVTDDDRLVVRNPKFVEDAAGLLASTSRRTLANYVGWRAVMSTMELLPADARKLEEEFTGALSGVGAAPPRWKGCLHKIGVNKYHVTPLRGAASSLYVRHHFKAKDKEVVLGMVSQLKAAFRKIIDGADWMDDCTKSKARKKLDAMDQVVGYPDELLCRRKVDKLFEDFKVSPYNHFENILAVSKFQRADRFKALRKALDPKHWTNRERMDMIYVDAFYVESNAIMLPAGILQGMFLSHDVPKYLTFGLLGSIIGHEIAHGFDNRGRQRDYKGNVVDWWSAESAKEFEDRSECFVRQYDRYNVTRVGLSVGGRRTLGENLANQIGARIAYTAYTDYAERNGPEPRLAGHNWSAKQMFWISMAQFRCWKMRDALLKQFVLQHSHAPFPFEVRGSVTNDDAFAEDFHCPEGSPMNQNEKCSIW